MLLGGTLLRLIGAYSLIECRQPLIQTVENGLKWLNYFGSFDFGMLWALGVIAAYLAWGLLLLLRGPRLLGFAMLRAASPSLAAGAEWAVAALTAAGAIVILWTMRPLVDVSFTRWTFLPTLGQLGLGVWLFLAAGRLSSVRTLSIRR
jgi:hypothetical protein